MRLHRRCTIRQKRQVFRQILVCRANLDALHRTFRFSSSLEDGAVAKNCHGRRVGWLLVDDGAFVRPLTGDGGR